MSLDPLDVQGFDFYARDNSREHHTERYDLVALRDKPTPILRRGFSFIFTLRFNRNFDEARDIVYIAFCFGPKPHVTKGTKIILPLLTRDKQMQKEMYRWNMTMQRHEGNAVTMQIHIPPNAQVGIWRCEIQTEIFGGRSYDAYRREDVYILFNPWCRDDGVYMDHEDDRQEYVLNDSGKIWCGTYKHPKGKRWIYGQFDEIVLPAVLFLLDKSHLPYVDWGSPVLVSRAITQVVNAFDDEGLLEGKWDGDYRGGTSPHAWTGSVAILSQFLKAGGRPVKYGQCWVFSALVVTICRALGIPCRSTTNYVSAHDTNCSLTVDRYFDLRGNRLEYGPRGESYRYKRVISYNYQRLNDQERRIQRYDWSKDAENQDWMYKRDLPDDGYRYRRQSWPRRSQIPCYEGRTESVQPSPDGGDGRGGFYDRNRSYFDGRGYSDTRSYFDGTGYNRNRSYFDGKGSYYNYNCYDNRKDQDSKSCLDGTVSCYNACRGYFEGKGNSNYDGDYHNRRGLGMDIKSGPLDGGYRYRPSYDYETRNFGNPSKSYSSPDNRDGRNDYNRGYFDNSRNYFWNRAYYNNDWDYSRNAFNRRSWDGSNRYYRTSCDNMEGNRNYGNRYWNRSFNDPNFDGGRHLNRNSYEQDRNFMPDYYEKQRMYSRNPMYGEGNYRNMDRLDRWDRMDRFDRMDRTGLYDRENRFDYDRFRNFNRLGPNHFDKYESFERPHFERERYRERLGSNPGRNYNRNYFDGDRGCMEGNRRNYGEPDNFESNRYWNRYYRDYSDRNRFEPDYDRQRFWNRHNLDGDMPERRWNRGSFDGDRFECNKKWDYERDWTKNRYWNRFNGDYYGGNYWDRARHWNRYGDFDNRDRHWNRNYFDGDRNWNIYGWNRGYSDENRYHFDMGRRFEYDSDRGNDYYRNGHQRGYFDGNYSKSLDYNYNKFNYGRVNGNRYYDIYKHNFPESYFDHPRDFYDNRYRNTDSSSYFNRNYYDRDYYNKRCFEGHDNRYDWRFNRDYHSPDYNRDYYNTCWTFHVWNEVWMARPDLPPGYGGWQVIDATPQEQNDTIVKCGPASVEAIRRGEVGFLYDTPFVFAEVNADLCHYQEDPRSDWGYNRLFLDRYQIGRRIVTKRVDIDDDVGENDLWDITREYKNLEEADAERFAVYNAVRGVPRTHPMQELPDDCYIQDVELSLIDIDAVPMGQDFNILINVSNNANEPRTINVMVSIASVFYHGMTAANIKRHQHTFTLKSRDKEVVKLHISPTEYLGKLVDHSMMKIYAIGHVKETGQNWSEEDDFTMMKPYLQIHTDQRWIVGQENRAEFSFRNPLNCRLTGCSYTVEGPGLQKTKVNHYREVQPNEVVTFEEGFFPHRAGERRIVANFNCKEIDCINGSLIVLVQ
nr:uncharacterized protein LOC111414340 [Onthophagus taurus]